jgi:hypothetical protein
MVINSETRGRVANASTQSDSANFATASLVYVEGQDNQMQTVEGQVNQGSSALTQSDPVALDQVNQGLSNQGSRTTELSKFVNPVELNLSNLTMTPDNIDKENGSEYSGSESPPPPPPPRNLPVANDLLFNKDARFFLPVRLSDYNLGPSNNIGNPEEGRPDSPPPPPPPREQRSSSPLPAINPKILSQGFMGIGPSDPKTGDRLNTIEVPKRPLTSVEVAGKNPGKALQLVGVNQNELWV